MWHPWHSYSQFKWWHIAESSCWSFFCMYLQENVHSFLFSRFLLMIFLNFFVDRIQDLCIIFAIIVVFLVFFNTYIFQAGLVSLLIRKFKTTIIISILYLALSVGLHVWTMVSAPWSGFELNEKITYKFLPIMF